LVSRFGWKVNDSLAISNFVWILRSSLILRSEEASDCRDSAIDAERQRSYTRGLDPMQVGATRADPYPHFALVRFLKEVRESMLIAYDLSDGSSRVFQQGLQTYL
jgi:hypothetical protein